MRQLVPLYTWAQDTATWTARLDLLTAGDIVVVAGPGSGPPKWTDPDLATRIAECQARKLHVLGYVPLGYGDYFIDDVLSDLVDWHHNHAITRIFFDEWPAEWTQRHLGALWGAVRGYAGRGSVDRPIMVVNPGVDTPMDDIEPPAGTLIVTHESRDIPEPRRPKRWEVALVHSYPDPYIGGSHLHAQGWEWGHVTSDGADGNPWDEVAS